MLVMRIGIAASALKRPEISYGDIVHVVRTGDYLGADDSGLVWWVGTTPSGVDVEVAALTARGGGALVVIHAFPMRWRKR